MPSTTENDGFRALIMQRIENKKALIRNAKPLGWRLDECRECVDRCQARVCDAERSMSLAQQTLAEAQKDLADKQKALHDLETELASAESHTKQSSSIEKMASSVSRVINEMQSGGQVPQHIMQETLNHMGSLMCGVNRIVDEIRNNTQNSLSADPNGKSSGPRQAQSSTGGTPPTGTTKTDAAVEAAPTTAVSNAIGGSSQQTGKTSVAEIAQSLEAKLSGITDDAKK